jgi:hypothetical protein
MSDVATAASWQEARPLREVGAVNECFHESRDLARVGRTVSVDQGDDVASCSCDPARERITFATTRLPDDAYIWPYLTGDPHSTIDGKAVD